MELWYNMRHRKAFQRSPMTSLFRTTTTKKSENIMSKIDNDSLEKLKDLLNKSYAISTVLTEASLNNGFKPHAVTASIIEEFLEKALEILKDF